MTNQFEYHPCLNQRLLIDECRRLGVAVTAYWGRAVGRVFDDPVLRAIAGRRAKTVAQIVSRWLIQQEGVVALSRTTNRGWIPANLDVFGFQLSPDENAGDQPAAGLMGRFASSPAPAGAWGAKRP